MGLNYPILMDADLWKGHEDDIVQVFSFAAQYSLVPTVELAEEHGVFSMMIHLPKFHIMVKGRGKSLELAQFGAVDAFNHQMQKNSDYLKTCRTVAKEHGGCLSTSNVTAFWAFYKASYGGFPILEVEAKKGITTTIISIDDHTLAKISIAGKDTTKQTLAYLAGAVRLTQEEPFLLDDFIEVSKLKLKKLIGEANYQGLKGLQLPSFYVDTATCDTEKKLVPYEAWEINEVLDRGSDLVKWEEQHSSRQGMSSMTAMRNSRARLPVNVHSQKILRLIESNTYSIIVGRTGSGKTTQVPQLLLERAIKKGHGGLCNIICTQPRRIAAMSIARRVAEERGEELGETVGHHVRGDVVLPPEGGSITFCTTGILLQQLKHQPDRVFDFTTHILVDEVHERDMLVDILLVVLKTKMAARAQAKKIFPRVVLMSATIDTALFSRYFAQQNTFGGFVPCPSVSIPGRTFSVEHTYLDDIVKDIRRSYRRNEYWFFLSERKTMKYLRLEKDFVSSARDQDTKEPDLTANMHQADASTEDRIFEEEYDSNDAIVPVGLITITIAHVAKTTKDGAILVFLPGYQDLVNVHSWLIKSPLGVEFSNENKYKLILLHSNASAEEQAQVFQPLPVGCRRVILATNIAETSLTIADVQHVIDSGKCKENLFGHKRGIDGLVCTWVSQANSKQREGRAGRVRNGNYYALFTEERLQSFRETQKAEILRADLQLVCLTVKSHAVETSIKDFLGLALECPPPIAIDAAISRLRVLGALTQSEGSHEKLTPLGRVLSTFSIKPAFAKMAIMGVIFRCLDSMLILAAIADSKPLLVRPPDKKPEALAAEEMFMDGHNSEHIARLHAFKCLQKIKWVNGAYAAQIWATKNYVNLGAYLDIERGAEAIYRNMMACGLVPDLSPDERRFQDAVLDPQFGDTTLNEHSGNVKLIKALLLTALSPNLAASSSGFHDSYFRTATEENLKISYGSIFSEVKSRVDYRDAIFVASTLINDQCKKLMLREVTEITPLMATLFGGALADHTKKRDAADFVIGGWLPFELVVAGFRAPEAVASLAEFKQALDKVIHIVLQKLTGERETRKDGYLANSRPERTILDGAVRLLNADPTAPEAHLSLRYKGTSPFEPLDESPLVNHSDCFQKE